MNDRELRLQVLHDRANAIMARAAGDLQALMPVLSKEVEFRIYPGTSTPAYEVDYWEAELSQVGCIILTTDGELKELTIGALPLMNQGMFPMENLKDLNLHPLHYMLYLYGAVNQALQQVKEEALPSEGAE